MIARSGKPGRQRLYEYGLDGDWRPAGEVVRCEREEALRVRPRVKQEARARLQRVRKWYRRQPRRVFEHIHATNAWGGDESVSGIGSTLDQTARVRATLPTLLSGVKASTLLDIPCGDWNWMRETPLPGIKIIGADVVPALIERNRSDHGHLAEFVVLDAARSPLPAVDVIMARDLLVHLSYREIVSVLENFRSSGSTFLLTTTFSSPTRTNVDVAAGSWRPLNLQAEPFLFPSPLQILVEGCTENNGAYSDKAMGLWRVADLPRLEHLRRRRLRGGRNQPSGDVWQIP